MLGHLAVEGLSHLRFVGLPSEARQLALQELDLRKSTRHGNSAHTCRHWVPALATCFAFQHTHVPAPASAFEASHVSCLSEVVGGADRRGGSEKPAIAKPHFKRS